MSMIPGRFSHFSFWLPLSCSPWIIAPSFFRPWVVSPTFPFALGTFRLLILLMICVQEKFSTSIVVSDMILRHNKRHERGNEIEWYNRMINSLFCVKIYSTWYWYWQFIMRLSTSQKLKKKKKKKVILFKLKIFIMFHNFINRCTRAISLNSSAPRMAKTPLTLDHSECKNKMG